MEGDKIKAKVNDRPSISSEQSAQHMSRDVYSGVATLLALCADLTCSLTLRVLVDVWAQDFCITVMGRNLSVLY